MAGATQPLSFGDRVELPAETGFASFDASGRLIDSNRAWHALSGMTSADWAQSGADEPAERELEAGGEDDDEISHLAQILGACQEIRGFPESDPRRIGKAIDAWRACTGAIEARGPDGRWRLLTAHRTGTGARSYHAADIDGRETAHLLAGRLLIENPMAIWALDSHSGGLAFANHAARELFARSEPDDARRAILDSFVMPHQRSQIENAGDPAGRVDFVDALVQTDDGRRLWTAGAVKGIALGHHRLTLCAMFDVTESSQHDHEKARALELLTDAFDALDEGLVLYDAEFRFVMANRRYREMFHPSSPPPQPGDLAAETEMALIMAGTYDIPDGVSRTAYAKELLAKICTPQSEVEIALQDGRTVIRKNHETSLGGFLVTYKEITAERRAERAEREADLLVRTIIESAPTIFLVTRISDGEILYMPPTARERFGDVDTTLGFFLDPADRETYLKALAATGSLNDYPVRFCQSDGTVMHGLTTARVVDYRGEDVIISATRDITETLAMQAELERQREIAHQNEKLSALGELLAGVSHELNNPLSIIVGYALMLQDKVSDPVLRRRIDRIAQAAERCTKIVRTFLAMARERPQRVEEVSLNEVIDVAVEVAGYGLRSAGASLVLKLAPDLPPISGDPDQLAQVFTNLVVNAEHALAALGRAGRLEIQTRHDPSTRQVVAEIRDNGPGIPPEIQARIFEPFFTTKDPGKGTGIGLAFCHRVMERHGGRIAILSEQGAGACFELRLPEARRTRSDAASGADERAAGSETGGRVLVIDDEIEVAEVISEMLADLGFAVETCHSGETALERIATGSFDAILSDVKMPGLDGPALLTRLVRERPGAALRLGFVTGDTMGDRAQEFLAGCGRPHLAKPIDPRSLAAFVEALCTGAEPPIDARGGAEAPR
ncbi:MAG: ATP-binding protein [Pikeienuella sp.]